MELKYVGPKPIITHTGIEFDNNKEDKYAYLNIVLQLLKALDHEYFEDRTYTFDTDSNRLKDKEMSEELKKYCPDIKALMEQNNNDIEEEIAHNLQRAHDNTILSEIDKEVLENNINIMHDYLVQRKINKSVYYCAVDSIASILKKDNIDYIIVPMFQTFAHVLHSIQGSFKRQNSNIDTKINVYQEDGKLLAKLQIINN